MDINETTAARALCSGDDKLRDVNLSKRIKPLFSLADTDIGEFFEVTDTSLWIKDARYQRVALQFPDSFLQFACDVSKLIEEQTGAKTFILADTSYRSCCVDELAASHAACDAIVHYGDACFSAPTMRVPIRHVLGKLPFSEDAFINALSINPELSSEETSLIILTDAPYAHAMDSIVTRLKRIFKFDILEARTPSLDYVTTEYQISLGRMLPIVFTQSTEPTTVLFIGEEKSPLLPLFLLTYPHCSKIIHYNPVTDLTNVNSSTAWRHLRKRLFLLEKVRDARTIGIVVGTVGIKGHREAVTRLRMLCQTALKKAYVISVGKVNVAKLSNFSEIDAFVLISCPFGIILDTNDYFKPVVTIFEAEMALNPDKSWFADKGWNAEFEQLLGDKIGEHSEGGKTDVSLLTGNIRLEGAQQSTTEMSDGTNQQIALYSAGDYFKERSWCGLDDSIQLDLEVKVTEGRSGIAANYSKEGDSTR